MDTALVGYLVSYHRRALAIRSGGILEQPLTLSPEATELETVSHLTAHLDETDRLAWGIALGETVKANREAITRLLAWAREGDDRGEKALAQGKKLLAEIEAANWYMEML